MLYSESYIAGVQAYRRGMPRAVRYGGLWRYHEREWIEGWDAAHRLDNNSAMSKAIREANEQGFPFSLVLFDTDHTYRLCVPRGSVGRSKSNTLQWVRVNPNSRKSNLRYS